MRLRNEDSNKRWFGIRARGGGGGGGRGGKFMGKLSFVRPP